MIDNSREYIICAAIWYDDGISVDQNAKEEVKFPMHGKGRTYHNDNINTGFVIAGHRHYNIISILPTNPSYNGGIESVQGFLTSKGRFVDRYQGMYLAYLAQQVNAERAINKEFSGKFDNDVLLKDIPSDNRRGKCPWNSLYSEDLY